MSKLTKRQKEIQVFRAIKKGIRENLHRNISKKIKDIIEDKSTPEDWLNEDNNKLYNAVIREIVPKDYKE